MNRGIHSFHPFVSFFYYVGAAALVMLYKHPVFLFVAALLFIFFHLQLDKGKTLRSWLVMMFFLSIFFLIINPLINRRGTHILFYLYHNPVMLEAIIQGVILALSIFTLLVLFASYNLVITAEKFLFLFSRILPQWALLTMLSMRFVPLLKRRLREIESVQKGKGLSVSEGKIRTRAKNGILLIQILLTWSLEEAIQTADSMAARGYGLKKRSKYTPFKMKIQDWLVLFTLLLIGSVAVAGWWLGDGVLSIYPILESPVIQGREWFYLGVFTLYLAIPLFIEGRDTVRWHFWKQKI
ncbi:energy-coupling factor transporter transmembrane component T [Metabacillus litoralis]|uniref:energy-coupling factor transporter transmembrane component T n=1 Tax=Metabacillus litoralis TaxID=152268 RepID=UPI000EF57C99|nr:energy-coupling factor transporter transmembrane component T [Metabacillus litoralis]MCM3161271.1 energy-coupling factor transporter transmembrane protein EcfT [Metabacillus litoralis]